MKVFILRGGEKTEAEVEKRTERGRPRFWIEEKIQQTSQEPERRGDEPTPEVVDTMQEDTPEEVDTARKMWLNEKVTSLERERGIEGEAPTDGGEACPPREGGHGDL